MLSTVPSRLHTAVRLTMDNIEYVNAGNDIVDRKPPLVVGNRTRVVSADAIDRIKRVEGQRRPSQRFAVGPQDAAGKRRAPKEQDHHLLWIGAVVTLHASIDVHTISGRKSCGSDTQERVLARFQFRQGKTPIGVGCCGP